MSKPAASSRTPAPMMRDISMLPTAQASPQARRIDRKLLQQHAALPSIDLAEKPRSARGVLAPGRQAQGDRLIHKTVALVYPRALGYNGLIIIGVVLDRSTTDPWRRSRRQRRR